MRETDTVEKETGIKKGDMREKFQRGNTRNLVIISSGYDPISFRFLTELICIGREIFKKRMELIIPHDPSADISFPGEKIQIHTIKDFSAKQKSRMNPLLLLVNHGVIELKTSCHLLRGSTSDIHLFFLCQSKIIPLFVLKLQNKKSILMLGASFSGMYRAQQSVSLKIFSIIEQINFLLADKLIIYSPVLISEWHLEPYRYKILIAHEHFLNFNTFTVTTPLSARPALIGYIGRFSPEKGIQHFVSSLPAILDAHKEFRVLIGGDGPLMESVRLGIKRQNQNARVELPGWISHNELPRYFNQVRLLVLPSHTEGLPNIMLEAMACGTPVLATSVGAIPDIIKDGITGFIMENNSPECIAKNVQRALNCPDLAVISENGRRFVRENYSFERTVHEWKKIVDTM